MPTRTPTIPNYNSIGQGYDITRKADPEILSSLTRLLMLQHEGEYLDVACGTGNYTVGLSKLGGRWSACDQSEHMLAEAQRKSSQISWQRHDVSALGYPDRRFDGAICSLAIHHFAHLAVAFSEISRVLKPGARLIVFTSTPEQMQGYWLNHYFPEMMRRSCEQMPSLRAVQSALTEARLQMDRQEPFFITPRLQDFFLYSGKSRPEMYLSSRVRNGISSFHNFCAEAELEMGLQRLAQDIDSGAIGDIMARYAHEGGDYLFIRAQKADGIT